MRMETEMERKFTETNIKRMGTNDEFDESISY